ncbi:ATP-binding protein [Deinococcus altitudinis]|uniref:ATP-binding protein n=1 Tax=Deinococcus altitudinis TaxID=468914 RepID=UPI003891F5ED
MSEESRHRLFQLCEDFALELNSQVMTEESRPLNLTLPDLTGTPFSAVCESFGLNATEQLVLFLAVTAQLRPGLMVRCCAVELMLYDTPQMLQAFLCPYVAQQWFGPIAPEAFAPTSPLRRLGLIDLHATSFGNGSGSESLAELRVTPGALAFVQGSEEMSAEVSAFLTPLESAAWLGASQQAALEELSGLLAGPASGGGAAAPSVLNLYGPSLDASLEVMQMYSGPPPAPLPATARKGASRARAAAVAPVSRSGPRPWLLNFEQVSRVIQQDHATPGGILGLLQRDLTYLGGVLVVPLEESPGSASFGAGEQGSALHAAGWSASSLVQALCGLLSTPVVLVSRDPVGLELAADLYAIAVERPGPEEQVRFWGQALGFSELVTAGMSAELEHLTTQFSLSSQKIQQVARDAARHAQQRHGGRLTPAHLLPEVWEACKRQGRKAFQGLAEAVQANADWDSLILPPEDLLTLKDIVVQVQHRHQVYRAWGYGVQERGLGITVLFSGTSGGGKTFSAEVLAHALNLDLYRIDLSNVSSKWIGETEKNLKKVFDAADEGGAILLFDEADSVFGKRADVQGSNDRYANMTTNYLLQRMEAYRGLAILTTNFEGNIDPAFMRRIRFTVRFREPDEAMRAQLWKRAFPAGVHTEDLDHGALARPKLTGANIKSIAMNASFLASARGTAVTTTLIEEAITRELRRQGRLNLSAASR